ncbi:MAG: ribonuclease HI family protein [Candidatus Parcubacteria bacterium]|nr:ribonuclease HI family protein [Candidatus Parcubacteria bacterium]
MTEIKVYADGGSRGNPGPAAIGVVVGEKEYAQCIGKATNNVAEYQAAILALKKTRSLLGKEKLKDTLVIVHMDSELVVKQLTGQYKILEHDLQPYFLEVWNLKFDFPHLNFLHIPREKNTRADRLVNKALDGDSARLL